MLMYFLPNSEGGMTQPCKMALLFQADAPPPRRLGFDQLADISSFALERIEQSAADHYGNLGPDMDFFF